MSNITVEIGGEELTLFRPKGRAGREFIVKVHDALTIIAPVMDLQDELDSLAMTTIVGAANALFQTKELKFEDELLPGLYRYSKEHRDDSNEDILKMLDEIDDPPFQIAEIFMQAMAFWAGMGTRQKEALTEAQKK